MYSLYYMLSYSIDWHLLDVVYNILNTQRYVTSVAGQTCSYTVVRRRREASNLYLNENVSLLRHS